LPVPVRLGLEAAPGPLRGKRFWVAPESDVHSHGHRPWSEIRDWLNRTGLPDSTRLRAQRVFELLAQVESRVHGIEPDKVEFHEVGAWDSIADVVSSSLLLDWAGIETASTGPLPLGGGRVRSAHGFLPVPAPATALLLEGLEVRDDGVGGERVTPTGAAILRALEPSAEPSATGRLLTSGMGFGSRELPGIPNCLQVLILRRGLPSVARSGASWEIDADRVLVLSFEIDDQTPEDFALAMDRLRERPDVLSVTVRQAAGKSGRPTWSVEILAQREALYDVAEACFGETSTLGLRWRESDRLVLRRESRTVEVGERRLDVKVSHRPGAPSPKVEHRDVATAGGYAQREALRRRGAEAAVDDGAEHG